MTVTFIIVACSDDSNKDSSGDNTDKKETLRVGGPDVLPYTWFRDENNELVGFDVDLAEIIAEKLDMELELQVINKDATIPSLQERKVDVLMGGMARTPEREK